MSIRQLYPIPDVDPCWTVPQNFEAVFDWEYDEGRQQLIRLYQKGKDMQWDALNRIDWTLDLDPENPMQTPDETMGIFHTSHWAKMNNKERIELRRHLQGWTTSQFLQGEQAAMLCSAKIVQQVPDMDAKLYASTQVMDEARHVEAFKKLQGLFGVAYPMSPPLQSLIDQALRDSRWDMTYLAMQVVIEGLALSAFGNMRDISRNKLAQQVNAYVMQDEARHVAFGRVTLKDYYPQLTQKERDEREEFLIEASYYMRDRFEAKEVYECLDMPVDEIVELERQSPFQVMFRKMLFQRIVPIVHDIGLWSEKIQKAYADMGVIDFANFQYDALTQHDEERAYALDEETRKQREAYVREVAALGKTA